MSITEARFHSLAIIWRGIWKMLKGKLLIMWLPRQEPVFHEAEPKEEGENKSCQWFLNEASDWTPPTYPTVLRKQQRDQGFYKFRSEIFRIIESQRVANFTFSWLETLTLAIINPYHYSYWCCFLQLHVLHMLWSQRLRSTEMRRTIHDTSSVHQSTWQLFIRKWLLQCKEHHRLISSDGCEGKWNFPVGSFLHPLRKLLSGYLIKRCQMGLLTKQLWPSDSAFYVASQPVNLAAFIHWPLHSDLLLKPTRNANRTHIPRALRVQAFLGSVWWFGSVLASEGRLRLPATKLFLFNIHFFFFLP